MTTLFSSSNDPVADAFSFTAVGRKNPSLADLSILAADILTTTFAELIAVLPSEGRDQWAAKLFSWLRINGPSGDDTITGEGKDDLILLYHWMASGLCELIEHGALPRAIETPESMAALALLREVVFKANLRPQTMPPAAAAVTAEAVPAEVDPIDQCVADYRALGSSQFRKKYLENRENRRIYDRACQTGRV